MSEIDYEDLELVFQTYISDYVKENQHRLGFLSIRQFTLLFTPELKQKAIEDEIFRLTAYLAEDKFVDYLSFGPDLTNGRFVDEEEELYEILQDQFVEMTQNTFHVTDDIKNAVTSFKTKEISETYEEFELIIELLLLIKHYIELSNIYFYFDDSYGTQSNIFACFDTSYSYKTIEYLHKQLSSEKLIKCNEVTFYHRLTNNERQLGEIEMLAPPIEWHSTKALLAYFINKFFYNIPRFWKISEGIFKTRHGKKYTSLRQSSISSTAEKPRGAEVIDRIYREFMEIAERGN